VHTAPGHGVDDFAICQKHNYDASENETLPVLCPVDDTGKFTADAGPVFAGLDVLSQGNTAVLEVRQHLLPSLLPSPPSFLLSFLLSLRPSLLTSFLPSLLLAEPTSEIPRLACI
jgi:hypothetical protein